MKAQKILIADDDREHLLMLALMLRKEGYEVISAFDAKHAIQLAVEQNPDILILDVHMGIEGGYDVQERLQQINEFSQKPVIYITGDKSCWVKFISSGLGAHAVMRKPFDRGELLATLANILSVVSPADTDTVAPAQSDSVTT